MIGGTVAKIQDKVFICWPSNWFYCIHRSIFRTLENILCQLEVRLQRYRRKHLFDCFKIWFTVFAVLFLQHWGKFYVDWRYGWKDTGENDFSPAFKFSLQHLPFYFLNIGSYFASIGGTVANIRTKTLIHRHRNGVFCICCSIFRTFQVILHRLVLRFLRYERKDSFASFEMVFTAFAILFLEHWRLFCFDWKYCCKIRAKKFIFQLWNWFTAFDILFLEHWRLVCIDWWYGSQDTGENIYSPDLK